MSHLPKEGDIVLSNKYWDRNNIAKRLITISQTSKASFYTWEQTQDQMKSSNINIPITIINDNESLEVLPLKPQRIAIDLETTGLNYREDMIVGIGVTWSNSGDSAYLSLADDTDNNVKSKFYIWLSSILQNENIVKVFHNAKFDLKFLKAFGFKVNGIIDDTMIQHYVLTPHASHALKFLAQNTLGIYYDDYNSMVKGRNILEVPIEEISRYCCFDTWCTFLLDDHFRPNMPTKLLNLYELEREVMLVVVDMEMKGINVNPDACLKASQEMQLIMEKISKEIKELTKTETNIASHEQVSELLFKQLGIPLQYTVANKKGFSTSEDVLINILNHTNSDTIERKVIEGILEYRKTSKLKSTYADKVISLLNKDGRLRGEFNQCRAVTGRFSSSNPNMQNFPKQFRYMFIPNNGHILIAADYSQCEVRILAYFSQESTLINAFNEGRDVHAEVAKKLFKTQTITDKQRYAGKQINFSIAYGLEAPRLAVALGCNLVEAQEMLDDYWVAVPKVKEYLEDVHRRAIALGYSETILGRRRYYEFTAPILQELRGKNPLRVPIRALKKHLNSLDAKTLREAGNAPIQGSNADITKLAMVECPKKLIGIDCDLLLQVHDELVFTCEKPSLMDAVEIIQETMSSVFDLGVPLKVDLKIGTNWSELYDV